MKIVNVVPLAKGLLKNDLSYFTTKDIENGSIVSIALRGKKTLGLVISVENVSDTKMDIKEMDFNLKKIIEVKDNSIFLKEYLQSALEIGKYFVSGKNNAIASLIPKLFREDYDKIAKFKSSSEARPSALSSAAQNIKTEKLILQEPFEDRVSIYKTLIRENFALKKSVFIVLPTERDIKSFEEYLSKGINDFTFVIHGGLNAKKLLKNLKR